MAALCPFMVAAGRQGLPQGWSPETLFQSRGRVSTQCTLVQASPLPSSFLLLLFSLLARQGWESMRGEHSPCFLFLGAHVTVTALGLSPTWFPNVPLGRLQGCRGLVCMVFAGTPPGLAHSKDGPPLAERVLGLPFRHLHGLASACLSGLLSQPVPSPDRSWFPA